MSKFTQDAIRILDKCDFDSFASRDSIPQDISLEILKYLEILYEAF